MKNKEEIKEMMEKCKKLREVIPHHTAFGDDNWRPLEIEANTLKSCLDDSEIEVRGKLDDRLEIVGDDTDEAISDSQIRAYDWILENTDDELVEDGDIEVFSKKAKESTR